MKKWLSVLLVLALVLSLMPVTAFAEEGDPGEGAPAHEHSYTATETVAPTCTEQGYTVYECECGASEKRDLTDALGHDWGEGTVTLEPTTEAEGERSYTCARCGATKTESIEKLEAQPEEPGEPEEPEQPDEGDTPDEPEETPDPEEPGAEGDDPAGDDESGEEPSDPDSKADAEESEEEDKDDAAEADGEEKGEDEEEITEEISLEEFQEEIRAINNTRAPDTVPDTMYVEPTDANGLTERLYIDVSRVTKTMSSSWSSKTYTYEVTCSICLPDTALEHIADCKFSWLAGQDATITVTDSAGVTHNGVTSGTRAVPSVGETEKYYFKKGQNGQTFIITYVVTTDTVPTDLWIKAKDNGLPVQVDVEKLSTVDSTVDGISVRTYTCELVLPGTAVLGSCKLTWNGELKAAVVDDPNGTAVTDPNGPYKSGKCPIPDIGGTKKYVFEKGSRRVEFVVTAYNALPDTMWVELSTSGQTGQEQTEFTDPWQTEFAGLEQTEFTEPEQSELTSLEQSELTSLEQTASLNAQRIYLTKSGNSYKLELPFGVPDGCVFHWNGPLKASIANDPNGPYASGECPVPDAGSTKTYTFTNEKGDRVSFTVTTSVIEPKLRVEPSEANGLPAAIDVFVSNTNTSTSGSGNNKKYTYTYTSGLYLPGNVDPADCVLTWDGSITATVNGSSCSSGTCQVPTAGSTTTYTFVNGNKTYKYDITTHQGSSGVPAVFIDIDESKGTIEAMDGDPCHDTECSGRINIDGSWYELTKMKGRGNYTWEKAQDKKPYNITLGEEIDFPGVVSSGKTKKWSFLAEVFDPSLLCNRSGYWLASQIGVGQDTTSADVWMNGEYQGCYTVTPKTDSFVPAGGFMVEEDNYLEDPASAGGDWQFTLDKLEEDSGWSSCYNRITVKEMKGSWDAASIQAWLQDAWDAITTWDENDPTIDGFNEKGKHYTDYIDIASFAKMYLMHEYVKSYDICAGSLLFYCDGDSVSGKLYAGPLWDLDNAMGSVYSNGELGPVADRRSGRGNFIQNVNEEDYKTSFYKALGKHKDFMAEVSRQYSYYSWAFNGLPDTIDNLSGSISASAEMNHAKVTKISSSYDNHYYGRGGATINYNNEGYVETYYQTTSWSVYVQNLKTYATARSDWFTLPKAWFHDFDGAVCAHRYTEVINTEPTCTAEGLATYTCTLCGDSYQETLPKLAHEFQLSSDDGRYHCVNCGENGYVTFVCDPGLSVTAYETQDLNGAHEDNATFAYPRDSSSGAIDLTSGNGQVNFDIVPDPDSGRELESVVAEPSDHFKNLKLPPDTPSYRLTKVTGAVTVTVTAKKCTVTFDANGFGTAPDPLTVFKNDVAVELPKLSTPGYAFVGWYMDPDCTQAFTAPVTDDITLYAKWQELTEPAFKVNSLVLSGKIGVNFFMDLPALDGVDYSTSYMEFTVSGKDGKTTQDPFDPNDKNQTGDYYGFTCYVNSIQMAETITATFHYGENQTVVKTYSIKEYLNRLDTNAASFDETTIKLFHALADYGHYAQPFLSDATGWTIGTDYAEMNKYYTGSYSIDEVISAVANYAISSENSDPDIEKISYTLALDSGTDIRVYFKPVSGYSGSFTVTVDGGTWNAVKQSDGRYLVTIPGISAHLLGTTYTIVATTDEGNAAVRVSALSYVQALLSVYTDSRYLNAAAALYYYYDAARAYKANH